MKIYNFNYKLVKFTIFDAERFFGMYSNSKPFFDNKSIDIAPTDQYTH